MGYRVPEAVNLFNVYNGTSRQVGVTGSVELPEFAYMTNTISAAGMAGEYDAPVIGHIASQKLKIPFGQIDEQEFFAMVESSSNITLRASIQTRDEQTNEPEMVLMTITVRGATTDFTPGTIEKGKTMNASITKEVAYIKIVINNVVCLELDKFNSIFIINGKDIFAKVRAMI
ncbi:phage major tail tube protein [Anaerocolumna sp. AGMB13020]|uniref:phage major tail tube protein n=1 Tax=Anaerocolumna sp. AGMB13020 TaxID=3081750 RepID=UPI00295450E9|nr:phage major tail tube protein [Anaerocolumna sp. AGMB13020]WOO34949.1 phage major tail tube protein [Anaerocolumna sp. AGMB13020]